MKNHIRLLGWTYIVVCSLALGLGMTICVQLKQDPTPSSQNAYAFVMPLVLLVACVALIPGILGGIGLVRSRPWARGIILILSVLLLTFIPIGTAVGIYGLWVLWKPEDSPITPALPRPIPRTSFLPSSPGFYTVLVVACVGAGFFLVLKFGFILHNDPLPEVFANTTLTGISVLVLLIGAVIGTMAAVQSVARRASTVSVRDEPYQTVSATIEVRYRRAAELAADPAKARYAALVERGETWSDAHITYYETPTLTATCDHLRPIEQALRAAAFDVRLYRNNQISAKCHIDFARLKQTVYVASTVSYSEFYMGNPDDHERPAAFLICSDHNSQIHTVHPDDSAPWFPTPYSSI